MNLQEWGAAIGAGFGTAALVVSGGKQWFAKRTEKKIDAVSVEIGVGTEGPSLLSLVASTNTQVSTISSSVSRLETHSEESKKNAADVLAELKRHGEKLEGQDRRLMDHSRRIGVIEGRHETCGFTSERVAELLALKTEDVARLLSAEKKEDARVLSVETKATAAKLAAKTEKTADDLAHQKGAA